MTEKVDWLLAVIEAAEIAERSGQPETAAACWRVFWEHDHRPAETQEEAVVEILAAALDATR